MRILGIDPGLITTGYGVVDIKAGNVKILEAGTKIVEAGTIEPDAKAPLAERLLKIHRTQQPFFKLISRMSWSWKNCTPIINTLPPPLF